MRNFLLRYENLLVLGYLFAFWGFDIYLLTQDIDMSKYNEFYSFVGKLFLLILTLPLLPYFFYYRLWKNGVKNGRVYNFYFPFSLLLIIIIALFTRLEILSLFLTLEDYFKTIRGFYRHSANTTISFYCLAAIYIVLQFIFIIDSFRMIRKQREERNNMINDIGR